MHSSIKEPIADIGITWSTSFPIALRIEMRTRLSRITDPMNEGDFPCIVGWNKVFERGMNAGEAIAEWDRVRVIEGTSIGSGLREKSWSPAVPRFCGIDRDGQTIADAGSVG